MTTDCLCLCYTMSELVASAFYPCPKPGKNDLRPFYPIQNQMRTGCMDCCLETDCLSYPTCQLGSVPEGTEWAGGWCQQSTGCGLEGDIVVGER